MFRILLNGLIALCASLPASASVFFDNGPPDLMSARTSDFDVGDQVADDFALTEAVVDGFFVRWFGVYFDPVTQLPGNPASPDDFVVRLFNDEGGMPETDPFFQQGAGDVGRTLTGQQLRVGPFAFEIYEYVAEVDPSGLEANTTYWLSIVNDTSADVGNNWAWTTSVPMTGNAQGRAADASPWLADNGELAFQFVIPEPGSATLAVIGLLGSVALRRRSA